MKKITFLMLFLSALCGYSQISNYAFVQSAGTYEPITGGTVLGSETPGGLNYVDPLNLAGANLPNTGDGFPIGFNFVFDGKVCNQFGVCTQGWISLGNTNLSPHVSNGSTNSRLPLESNATNFADLALISRIAAFSPGTQTPIIPQVGAEISFKTIGTLPNRILVVQWKNFKKSSNGDGDFYNFQIRLYETTNVVNIVYGTITNNATPLSIEAGLRGAPTDPTNYSIRTSTTGLNNSVAGSIVKSGSFYTADANTISSTLVPTSGLTFSWTPPACGNATALVMSNISTNGATLNWSGGLPAPKGYEYVISTSAAAPSGSGTAVTNPTATVSTLSPNTLYYVYLRSVCDSGFNNAWVLGGSFKTKCNDLAYFYEDFDSYNYADKVMPNCWDNTFTTGKAYVQFDQGNQTLISAPNTLFLEGSVQGVESNAVATTAYAIMPSVSNMQAGTNRLRFKAYSSDIERFLEVGYFTNMADAGSFVLLQKLAMSSATSVSSAPEFIITPSGLPAGVKNLVFKTKGNVIVTVVHHDSAPDTYDYSYITSRVYIDNVVWEQIPLCRDVKDVAVKGSTANTVDLSWTKGDTETAWQYALGSPSKSDPTLLPLADFNSPVISGATIAATVNNLTPSTAYRIWIRSKCGDGSLGAWIGPLTFSTMCSSVSDFTENFDAATVLPACWTKVGTTGTAAINTTSNPANPSAPYVLELASSSPTSAGMVAMPPLTNSADMTHRLRFKLRGSVNGAKVDIGYLTNPSDANTYVYLQTYTPSSTTDFNDVVSNLGAAPKSAYLVFRNPGTVNSSVYIDDVNWELIPLCPDIKNLSSSETSSTSIKLSWTKGGSESKWQYVLGDPSVSDPKTLAANAIDFISPVVNGTTVSGSVSNLNPGTSYKIWVRSKCDAANAFGAWIGPFVFSTPCSSVTDFVQNFDASTNMPSCWTKVGSGGSVYPVTLGTAPSSPNAFYLSTNSATSPAVLMMQPVSNSGDGSHRLKFKFQSSIPSAVLEVGFLLNPLDPASFAPLQSFTVGQNLKFQNKTVDLGYDPSTGFLAFRSTGAGDSDSKIYIDDVVWEATPTAVPAIASGIKSLPHPSCGNFTTAISWNNATGADGYKISIGTSSGSTNIINNVDLGDVLTYYFMGDTGTTYYYSIIPYNTFGNAKNNTVQSFATNANKCYCASLPSPADGSGITKVQISGTTINNTAKAYYDYTAKTINLRQGANANLQITYETGNYSYNTNIWIDFNDNYTFESNELVSSGVPSLIKPADTKTNSPAVYFLNASFMVSATANLGPHRMRIGAVRLGQNDPNPCYSGILGTTLDFTVNIIVPVANDEPTGAIVLTPGKAFADNAITGTNVGATGSVKETDPVCGGYNGDDVWYSASVPDSGNLIFEVNGVASGITNSAAALYRGQTDNLYLMGCDDSGSDAGGDHAKLGVTGRTPGEIIYMRVWENGGDATGPFKVSAYEGILSAASFDDINFSYYPNPVKDVLNLSFDQEINNIIVVNLLGQQVISQSFNATQGKIDMSYLPAGAYLVKVVAGSQSKAIKIIKE